MKLVLDFETIQSNLRRLGVSIKNLNNDKPLVLCCILKGAAYFGVDLSRHLESIGIEHSMYFVEASSYNGQEQGDVELLSRLVPEKFDGKHVLLVDELYDNGKTIHNIKQYLLDTIELDDTDITTCVMFKKLKETDYPPPDIFGSEVPNVWLVGYGLDDDGLKRGLDSLWAVPKPRGVKWNGDDWKIFINDSTK